MHTLVLAAEDAALAVSLIGAVDSHPSTVTLANGQDSIKGTSG
jgi:hypothetical protein